MSRLEQAAERFTHALSALEQAARAQAKKADSGAELQQRAAMLDSEREALLARIAELEDEHQTLASLSEEVEGRLDGAIGEIRSALGR